jgi:predicted acylesterase/phospholipase RssA
MRLFAVIMLLTLPSLRACALVVCLSLVGACSVVLRDPVPEDVYLQTSILGREDLRFWRNQNDPTQLTSGDSISWSLQQDNSSIMHTQHNYLAISGGGANGAYGAGLLVGWSQRGTRPEFTMVTGVSTGALIAPFVFLGPAYDEQLKLLYTTMDSSSVFFRRSIFSIFTGDSLANSTPLLRMLEKYVTDGMILEIASEYRKGRRLNIGTTNLDAGLPVIWNIGRIADSGHPDAAQLVRQILLASASVPGIFPPVLIEVQDSAGNTYDEMHVDGGTSAQMFLYPTDTNYAEYRDLLDIHGVPMAYVIRNSRLDPDYDPVPRRLANIAGRSVSSLIRTQGIGDVFRIAATTYRDGVTLKLTWIPMDAPDDPGEEIFDPVYMTAMFEYGYQRAVDDSAWTEMDFSTLLPGQKE